MPQAIDRKSVTDTNSTQIRRESTDASGTLKNTAMAYVLTLGDVSYGSRLVAMKEAVDTFLYSLPDLGLAGFGPAAAGSREDHIRSNEIKELACADSGVHFAQSSSCHLLIKVTSE
jgi:hypothetical protein